MNPPLESDVMDIIMPFYGHVCGMFIHLYHQFDSLLFQTNSII